MNGIRNSLSSTLLVAMITGAAVCGIISHSVQSNVEKDYKSQISRLNNTILEQRYEIISLDAEELAYDIVYVDATTGTNFLNQFLGKSEKEIEIYDKPTSVSEKLPYDITYTREEFNQLAETFEENSTKMNLGVEIVKEHYKNSDSAVLDSTTKKEISNALNINSNRKNTNDETPKTPKPPVDSKGSTNKKELPDYSNEPE